MRGVDILFLCKLCLEAVLSEYWKIKFFGNSRGRQSIVAQKNQTPIWPTLFSITFHGIYSSALSISRPRCSKLNILVC